MIWLVGNKGMLGTEVESLLRENGAQFAASDREVDVSQPGVVAEFLGSILRTARLTWIVNCAAYTAVDRAEDEPQIAHALNAVAPLNLSRAAAESGASLLHISTDYVFNGNKDGDYLEGDPTNPTSAYGRSKLEGELAIRGAVDRHVILRTAWLYGRNGKNFVDTMLNLFRERRDVRVVNDQTGNPTYARDLARAIIAILGHGGDHYGTFHFTNAGSATWFEFASAIYEEALSRGLSKQGIRLVPVATTDFPTKAVRPRNSCLSKEKIKREFDLSIRNWREALVAYLQEKAG
jgi:dTDP-4-dehydrorhamnose reductase